MSTVTPATRISEPVYQSFQWYRRTNVQNGALLPSFTMVLASQNLDVLGDANGNPVQILNLGTVGWNENLEGDAQIATLFGEEVTRADGTKLTVNALLDSILMARATAQAAAQITSAQAAQALSAAQAALMAKLPQPPIPVMD